MARHSIADDKQYHILVGVTGSQNMQNLGGRTAHLIKAEAQPAGTDEPSIVLEAGEMFWPNIKSSEDIYCKAINGSTVIGDMDV